MLHGDVKDVRKYKVPDNCIWDKISLNKSISPPTRFHFYDNLTYICKVSVRLIKLFELSIINITKNMPYQ